MNVVAGTYCQDCRYGTLTGLLVRSCAAHDGETRAGAGPTERITTMPKDTTAPRTRSRSEVMKAASTLERLIARRRAAEKKVATLDREVADARRALWTLIGAEQPDPGATTTKDGGPA